MCVCVQWSSPTPQLIFPHTCNTLILFSSLTLSFCSVLSIFLYYLVLSFFLSVILKLAFVYHLFCFVLCSVIVLCSLFLYHFV